MQDTGPEGGAGLAYHAHFSSDPNIVGDVVSGVIETVAPLLGSADDVPSLEIALFEIINNIAEHAYAGDINGPIELSVKTHGTGLEFSVVDRGAEMPGLSIPVTRSPNLAVPVQDLPEGGFGWFLIRTLVKDLMYRRVGHENCLTFRIGHMPG